METNENQPVQNTGANLGHVLRKLPGRMLLLLFVTVAGSALYKGAITIGALQWISSPGLHRVLYCLFELLLLYVHWRFVFQFAKWCRHHSYSKTEYFLAVSIVFVLYAAVYAAAFLLLDWDTFTWLFRITLNLCGLRFSTSFPVNVIPYMAAYQGGTLLVLLLEPLIARKQFESFLRFQNGEKGFVAKKFDALRDFLKWGF